MPDPLPSNSVVQDPSSTSGKITLAVWNCRGLANATPYINHLISDGSDIIILSEHWLWPFNINQLQDIHPDFTGFGVADKRLDEKSLLTRGCGGVGIIWRKSLPITPVSKIMSDRFCVIQLQPDNCGENIYIFGVYLPSCNHPAEEFMEYLADLENAISVLQQTGRVVLAGDFNVHLTESNQSPSRESLVHNCIHRHNLYSVSTSNIASGPNYTFFSSTLHSMVDYILTESSLAGQVASCSVHQHHPLNLSDHLPISVEITLHTRISPPPTVASRPINWAQAIENGDVHGFAEQVSSLTSPFVHATNQSVNELQWEIAFVTRGIIDAATRCLPRKKVKKKKSFVKDERLKDLCKTSKAAWIKWRDAGRPSSGSLADEKKRTKKNVRQFVATARARQERTKIHERDRMFKGNHPLRFKSSSPKAECTKLVVDGQSVTETSDILNTFRSFFGSLAQSEVPSTVSSTSPFKMEASSFGNNEQLLDTEICIEEIENALKILKLGKSGGLDCLSPEHIVYGGEMLKIWMKKIFNRILKLEEIPDCLKEGLVIPVYKRHGKDPLLVSSYRGITLSSVLCKVFEIILLQRLSSRRSRLPRSAADCLSKGSLMHGCHFCYSGDPYQPT